MTALLMARRKLGAAIYDIIKSVTWRTDNSMRSTEGKLIFVRASFPEATACPLIKFPFRSGPARDYSLIDRN